MFLHDRGLPRGVPGKQVVAALCKLGYEPARTKGDHQVLRHAGPSLRPGALKSIPVPLHREVAVGTPANILRWAGVTAEEFRELLRR